MVKLLDLSLICTRGLRGIRGTASNRISRKYASSNVSADQDFRGASKTEPIQVETDQTKQLFANNELKSKLNQEFLNSRKRIWTIPNALTFSRILITPAVGYFIYNGMSTEALYCLGFASITDLLDGFIARKFKQESDFGTILDPIADKFLLNTTLISLFCVELIPIWFLKTTIIRDMILVGGATYIRWVTFPIDPTWRRFINIKKYPTLGLEPVFSGKVYTALLCIYGLTRVSTGHMMGMTTYDRSMFAFELLIFATNCFSFGRYIMKMAVPDVKIKAPKMKGL